MTVVELVVVETTYCWNKLERPTPPQVLTLDLLMCGFQEDLGHTKMKHLLSSELNDSSLANAPGPCLYNQVVFLQPPLHQNSEVELDGLQQIQAELHETDQSIDNILDQYLVGG